MVEPGTRRPCSRRYGALICGLVLWLATCTAPNESPAAPTGVPAGPDPLTWQLTLPELAPVNRGGDALRVVATTSLVGDVVRAVGGAQIDLTVLFGPGQDSHSYTPGTGALARVAAADVVFVNGWGLEEGLLRQVANAAPAVPLVPVSAGITPLVRHARDDPGGQGSGGQPDPHVWLDPTNVIQWARNIASVLSQLDPVHAPDYRDNARAYEARLRDLDARIAAVLAPIPPARRKLVASHDVLAYLAARYDFQVIGTVIPSLSTVAEPSATDLRRLAEQMTAENVCALFAETSAGDRLVRAMAEELDHCDTVAVVALHTEALGPAGSGADTYLGLMETNSALIWQALR